ncbi:MAG TPA: universal stress protein [Candidatus Limnocylindrales bacterium]|nr:universal stress protein [Candidatus Limnocylindrales bacterium]
MAENTGEGPFERAVLGLNGGPTDELVVRFACELAKPYKAALIAVHVVEVDWRHDLDEDIAGRDEAASAILDLAEGVAERQQVKLETDLLQARDVGAALVDEASELGADMIIIGLPYRKRFGGDFAIGRTVPYVLQNAPCAVTVVREAMPSETNARGRTMVGASADGDRPTRR